MTYTSLNIPTVEQALRANGLNDAADRYAVQNSRNTVEIAACVNKMFDTQKHAAYNLLLAMWLTAVAITVFAGFVAMIIR